MQNNQRNPNEIVSIYFGENAKIMYPDDRLSSELEALGLNPQDYVFDIERKQIRNVDSLYAELLLMESNALKQQVSHLKQALYGSDAFDYMIAPPEQKVVGEPKNRDTLYYVKQINSSNEGFDKSKENIIKLARYFSQGDSLQPVRTEELIAQYKENNTDVSPTTEVAKKLFNSDISIFEWERAIIIKDFLYFQTTLDSDFPNTKDIYIKEVMNKKLIYGQSIVYNVNTKSYSINGEWIKQKNL